MSLLEFQRRMAADVLRPLTDDETMRDQLDDGSSMSHHAATYVKPNRELSAFERLEIYNRQYWFRVLAALTEDFPALQALVGTKQFEMLARDYLIAHPSQSFTLRDLGSRLPEWLTAHGEYAGDRKELAIDVARLEWAYVEAFDLAEFSPIGAGEIAQLDDDARIDLQPHLRLLALRHPVDELVLSVHKGHIPAEAASQASTATHSTAGTQLPEVDRSDTWIAIHRHDLTVYYRRLDREEYELLASLADGSTLGAALEAAFLHSSLTDEERGVSVGEWFRNWAELGWLCISKQTFAGTSEKIQ